MDHPLIQLQDMGRSPSKEMLLTLGFAGKTSFNNAILGNTSTQNFFYTIMGSELDRWQFVQNVFSDRDDVFSLPFLTSTLILLSNVFL